MAEEIVTQSRPLGIHQRSQKLREFGPCDLSELDDLILAWIEPRHDRLIFRSGELPLGLSRLSCSSVDGVLEVSRPGIVVAWWQSSTAAPKK